MKTCNPDGTPMCVMYEDHDGKCSSSTRDRDLEQVSRKLKSSHSDITETMGSLDKKDHKAYDFWWAYRDGLNHALAVIEGVRTNVPSS